MRSPKRLYAFSDFFSMSSAVFTWTRTGEGASAHAPPLPPIPPTPRARQCAAAADSRL
jgi:hypothetical protein